MNQTWAFPRSKLIEISKSAVFSKVENKIEQEEKLGCGYFGFTFGKPWVELQDMIKTHKSDRFWHRTYCEHSFVRASLHVACIDEAKIVIINEGPRFQDRWLGRENPGNLLWQDIER